MSLVKIVVAVLLSFSSFSVLAERKGVIICESYENSMTAKLVLRSYRPGQYEALSMVFQDRDVMDDHFSIFNHTGFILFRAKNRIEFHAFEYSDEFYVTVRAFGGERLIASRGKCQEE